MIYYKLEKYQQVFCYAYMKTLRPSEYVFKKSIITWNKIKKLLSKKSMTYCKIAILHVLDYVIHFMTIYY